MDNLRAPFSVITSQDLAISTKLASAFDLDWSSSEHFTTCVDSRASAAQPDLLCSSHFCSGLRGGDRMCLDSWAQRRHSTFSITVIHIELDRSVDFQRMAQAWYQGNNGECYFLRRWRLVYIMSPLTPLEHPYQKDRYQEDRCPSSPSPCAFSGPRRLFGMKWVERKWNECLSMSKPFWLCSQTPIQTPTLDHNVGVAIKSAHF